MQISKFSKSKVGEVAAGCWIVRLGVRYQTVSTVLSSFFLFFFIFLFFWWYLEAEGD